MIEGGKKNVCNLRRYEQIICWFKSSLIGRNSSRLLSIGQEFSIGCPLSVREPTSQPIRAQITKHKF